MSLVGLFAKMVNVYSPGNHQKIIGFLMISGGIEVAVNYFRANFYYRFLTESSILMPL